MALYFGIDLGTSNTVITCMGCMVRTITGGRLNSSLYGAKTSTIPIYYEGYRPIHYEGVRRPEDPVFEACTENEGLEEYRQRISDLKVIRMQPENTRLGGLRLFYEANQGRMSMPSVVYRKQTAVNTHIEPVHGINQIRKEPVFEMYAGMIAREMYDADQKCGARIPDGQRFFENTKIMMDLDEVYEGLSPANISAELLTVCFRTIKEAASILGRGEYRIGISYPVAQNGLIYRRNLEAAIREAKAKTSLDLPQEHIEMIQEPYAALLALHYDEFRKAYASSQVRGEQELNVNALIRENKVCNIGAMVIDIGGGTTDVAVLPIRYRGLNMPSYPEKVVTETRHRISHAVNPVGAFGGYDFDARIEDAIAEKLDRMMVERGEAVTEHNAYMNWVLHKRAVEMKHKAPSSSYSVRVQNYTSPMADNNLEFYVDGVDFNQMVMPLIDGTGGELDEDGRMDRYGNHLTISRIITQTLNDAGTDERGVSEVFVTGGMSKLPQIREMICDIWRTRMNGTLCHVHFSDDPLGDISRGVALYVLMRAVYQHIVEQGGENQWENGEIHLEEMVPMPRNALGLFADCGDGLLTEIVPCGSQLVVNDGKAENVLKADNALSVSITLYSGRSPYDQRLRLLGQYKKDFEPASRPKIESPISLRYSVNQDMQAVLYLEYCAADNRMQELQLDLIDISGQD